MPRRFLRRRTRSWRTKHASVSTCPPQGRRPETGILLPRGARMERKRASDFDPEVLGLFDQYVHGLIDRRGFLERAARYAVRGMTASMLLDALNPRFAEAQQIARDDERLTTSSVEYDSPKRNGK